MMTIEQLLEYPTADLAALTDEQLVAILSPYFPITRPENLIAHGAPINLEGIDPAIREIVEAQLAAAKDKAKTVKLGMKG